MHFKFPLTQSKALIQLLRLFLKVVNECRTRQQYKFCVGIRKAWLLQRCMWNGIIITRVAIYGRQRLLEYGMKVCPLIQELQEHRRDVPLDC